MYAEGFGSQSSGVGSAFPETGMGGAQVAGTSSSPSDIMMGGAASEGNFKELDKLLSQQFEEQRRLLYLTLVLQHPNLWRKSCRCARMQSQ